jgi:ADP-ribose pyrophosphatase YjhB (NUDIX family)
MTWRVPQSVRPKAVCIFRRDDRILVSEAGDSVKGDTFHGPPGGQIEFGETAADAARREMREELGVELESVTLLGVLENIFVYEGQRGHEIVFVFETKVGDPAFNEQEQVHGVEAGRAFVLTWERAADLLAAGGRLVPDGLFELL